MRFKNVRIAAVGHALPEECVTSAAIELELRPLYERFRLREGRLELMSGIRERRFFERGTRPSTAAARAGAQALEMSGLPREEIGCLIHGAVSRDFLEPATAAVVHRLLELPDACTVFDLSNACLGVLNGMVLIAGMIERGEVEAGMVVTAEEGRGLVEETVKDLLTSKTLNKRDFKHAFASLTIGSGAAAVVLQRAEGRRGRRLIGGAVMSATEHNVLCRGDRTYGTGGPLMTTDSEAMLQAGNELADRNFKRFLEAMQWARDDIDRVITHQVGSAHRRLLFETLQLDMKRDFPTIETLGNAGSAALPMSLSLALEKGFIKHGQRVALLGIGSGLNCMMLGLEW
jgi:3-oxoacyl-[acyl-carrier-protein] synthase-3